MKTVVRLFCTAMIGLSPGCATRSSAPVVPAAETPRFAFHDYTLAAGRPQPSGCYPQLVHVRPDGRARLRLTQEKSVDVDAAPGGMIPEGESDFCGLLLRTDFQRQTVVVRQFDLDKPL